MNETNPDMQRLDQLMKRDGAVPSEPQFYCYGIVVGMAFGLVCIYHWCAMTSATPMAMVAFEPKAGAKDGPFIAFLSQLGVLYILAAILERSLDVYVKIWRQPRREALESVIERLTADIAKAAAVDIPKLDLSVRDVRIALQR